MAISVENPMLKVDMSPLSKGALKSRKSKVLKVDGKRSTQKEVNGKKVERDKSQLTKSQNGKKPTVKK